MIKGDKEKVYFKDRGRIKQIADWMIEEEPFFIKRVNQIIQVDNIRNAFKFFLKKMPDPSDELDDGVFSNDELSYLLRENFRKFGKISVGSKLFETIFRKRITKTTKVKSRRISKNIEEVEVKKIETFSKQQNNIEIVFVNVKGEFQKRARNIKTGRFVKVPKGL